jgi:hypothetical protein
MLELGQSLRETQNDLIFVSIAAYRDPQLVPTIRDCLRKAKYPERLRFGICLQGAGEDAPLPFLDDPRFRVLTVDWRESKGACWARAEVMKLWRGEAWFLQVDSHCRFAAGWDDTLTRVALQTDAIKPILSTYASFFVPKDVGREVLAPFPLQVAFQAFTPAGLPQLQPSPLVLQSQSKLSMPARFLAAGFLFAPGCFVEEVPYDPELYFMGEEIAMTVRAFTHGYDLFHPTQTIVWHDYLRTNARKHWGDHTAENEIAHDWSERDSGSKQKVQRLLLGETVSAFGLGSARTLAEYEAYAGLSFRLRKAQLNTVRGGALPNPEVAPDWAERIFPWIARAQIKRAQLAPEALLDPSGWALTVQDDAGFEICRMDLAADELEPLYGSEEAIDLICEFPSETLPASWTLKILSHSRGWLNPIQGRFQDGDFAVLDDEAGVEEP